MEYKTGNVCPTTGEYVYSGHTGSCTCSPTSEERVIPLERGEIFPPIKSCGNGAYWKLLRET